MKTEDCGVRSTHCRQPRGEALGFVFSLGPLRKSYSEKRATQGGSGVLGARHGPCVVSSEVEMTDGQSLQPSLSPQSQVGLDRAPVIRFRLPFPEKESEDPKCNSLYV